MSVVNRDNKKIIFPVFCARKAPPISPSICKVTSLDHNLGCCYSHSQEVLSKMQDAVYNDVDTTFDFPYTIITGGRLSDSTVMS